jgi:hypothetical protein
MALYEVPYTLPLGEPALPVEFLEGKASERLGHLNFAELR